MIVMGQGIVPARADASISACPPLRPREPFGGANVRYVKRKVRRQPLGGAPGSPREP